MKNIILLFALILTAQLMAATNIKDTKIVLGIETDVDHIFQVNKSGTDKPYLKWKATTQKWYFSHNGITEDEMGSGSGGGGLEFWETAKVYAVNDIVIESNKIYICVSGHTSGTFASDIANWQLMESEASVISVIPSGNLAAEDVQSALEELQNEADDINTALGDLDSTYATDSDVAAKAPLASPTFTGTVSGITKSMVGLGNVDNTSDVNKPVSTAQQTALDLKANIASPALTGNPTAPTPTIGDDDTSIATTEFVTDAVSAASDPSKISGPASSVSNQVMLFDSTTGKLAKAATGSGYLKTTSGVAAFATYAEIGGKSQGGSTIAVDEIITPANQLTFTGGADYLIETGNKNLLINPGFEHQTIGTGWTGSCTGTASYTLLAGTTNPYPGENQHAEFTVTPGGSGGKCSLKQSVTTIPGSQGLISILHSAYGGGTAGISSAKIYTLVNGNRVTTKDISNYVAATNAAWGEDFNVPEVSTGTSLGIEIEVEILSSIGSYGVRLERASIQTGNVSVMSPIITSLTAYSATVTGFGTTTPASPVLYWQQIGEGIRVTGNWTNGTNAASLATISLPNSYTINSSKLSLANTTANSGVIVGQWATNGGANSGKIVTATGTSTSLVYFGGSYASAAGLTPSNGSAIANNSTPISIDFWVPISQLSGSTQVFASQCGAGCENEFSAIISSTDVPAEDRGHDFINGNCTNATTGRGTCNFNFALRCEVNGIGAAEAYIVSQTDTVLTYEARTSGGVATDSAVNIMCKKVGADYQSSRTIVGSFKEVVTAPGISKPKTCYGVYGGAGATLAAPSNCTTGTCGEMYDNCGTFSPPAYSSTGNVTNATFAAGTFANSTFLDCDCRAWDSGGNGLDCRFVYSSGDDDIASGATGGWIVDVNSSTANGTAVNAFTRISCTGQAP